MNELSEEEKSLGLRLLAGEVTEVQFNFLCHQKGFDKERILQHNQVLEDRINLFSVLLFYSLLILVLYFLGVF
jgi:hypothetical protein